MDGFSLDFDDVFGTAANIGAGLSYTQPRSLATVPTNALQSLQPVTAADDGGNWSDFWQGTLRTVVGYSIARDAARNGVGYTQPAAATTGPASVAAAARAGMSPLLMIGLAVGLIGAIVVAVKVAK